MLYYITYIISPCAYLGGFEVEQGQIAFFVARVGIDVDLTVLHM